MTTLNEIAYFIASRHDRAFDGKFVREVAFAAKYWRAFLIRQDIEKNLNSPHYVQKITLPLELVDQADNCYINIGCTILATTAIVPTPVRTKGYAPFAYVGSGTGLRPFNYVDFARVFTLSANRFTSPGAAIYYTMYNGKVIIYGNKTLDYLTFAHSFEDPIAAGEACINSSDCLGDDAPFFAPGDIVKTVIDGLLSGAFSIAVTNDESVTVEV